jgi:hypothetical protein
MNIENYSNILREDINQITFKKTMAVYGCDGCMRCSCRSLFKNVHKLWQLPNTADHGVNTWAKHQLYIPTVTLSCIQKDIVYFGINIFNRLPPRILEVKNEPSKCRVALRKYLLTHPFYSVDKSLSSSRAALLLHHQQLKSIKSLFLCLYILNCFK